MNLNPQYVQIGETFVKQYYLIFDGDMDGRVKLANFYHVSNNINAFASKNEQLSFCLKYCICKYCSFNFTWSHVSQNYQEFAIKM